MARTGCASAAVTSACGTARNRRRARQVLPAYGLQSLPPIPSQEFTKVLLRTTHGGHFNMAEKRTFLLCVDSLQASFRPFRAQAIIRLFRSYLSRPLRRTVVGCSKQQKW